MGPLKTSSRRSSTAAEKRSSSKSGTRRTSSGTPSGDRTSSASASSSRHQTHSSHSPPAAAKPHSSSGTSDQSLHRKNSATGELRGTPRAVASERDAKPLTELKPQGTTPASPPAAPKMAGVAASRSAAQPNSTGLPPPSAVSPSAMQAKSLNGAAAVPSAMGGPTAPVPAPSSRTMPNGTTAEQGPSAAGKQLAPATAAAAAATPSNMPGDTFAPWMRNGYGSMADIGMQNGYSSMAGMPNTAGGYGSRGTNGVDGMAQPMGSLYGGMAGAPTGSLYGGMGDPMNGAYDGMGGMPMGSLYGGMGGMPMGSLYGGMGGMPMGSLYGGMGGMPMGSLYGGMGGMPMGSLYGPMGSLYGGMGGMGSLYGGMGGMGSLYGGMGGMGSLYGGMGGMGSMYGGMGGMGSMYGGEYHSVVDATSRRDSFLNKNDLIRADVKPLQNPEKTYKKDEVTAKEVKLKESAKDTKGTKETSKKDSAKEEEKKEDAKVEEAKKDDAKAEKRKDDAKVEEEKKEDAKAEKKKDDAKMEKKKDDAKAEKKEDAKTEKKDDAKAEKKDDAKAEKKEDAKTDAKEADEKDAAKEAAKKEDTKEAPLKFTGTKIRSLAVIWPSGKEATISAKGRSTILVEGKETPLDEVVTMVDPTKPIEAASLSEARQQWVSGHNTTILIGTDTAQRKRAEDFMRDYLVTTTGKIAAGGEAFAIYITMTALKGADQGRDVLKDDATFEKLVLASSPVYGPALNDMTVKEVSTADAMKETITKGMMQAKEDEMVCSYFVLKQCRKSSMGELVYLSSLNITLVGSHVEHLIGLKAKNPEEPCRLYRYAVGGGSHSLCIGMMSDAESSASNVVEALKEMRTVENTEPRSGNVNRFIEYTKKEIPKCQERIAATTEENKKASFATMLQRMEMMLKDAEDLRKDPKQVAPKAYV